MNKLKFQLSKWSCYDRKITMTKGLQDKFKLSSDLIAVEDSGKRP